MNSGWFRERHVADPQTLEFLAIVVRFGEGGGKRDDTIEFFLPTYHYFFEFPFRIQSATVVHDVGEARKNGRSYDRVFATWNSLAVNSEVDQYIVWINRESGLIDRIEYTVREFGGAAAGATVFRDYRSVDGVQIPHLLSIRLVVPGGGEVEAHRVTVEEARWDRVAENLLSPDASLPSEADSKLRRVK